MHYECWMVLRNCSYTVTTEDAPVYAPMLINVTASQSLSRRAQLPKQTKNCLRCGNRKRAAKSKPDQNTPSHSGSKTDGSHTTNQHQKDLTPNQTHARSPARQCRYASSISSAETTTSASADKLPEQIWLRINHTPDHQTDAMLMVVSSREPFRFAPGVTSHGAKGKNQAVPA